MHMFSSSDHASRPTLTHLRAAALQLQDLRPMRPEGAQVEAREGVHAARVHLDAAVQRRALQACRVTCKRNWFTFKRCRGADAEISLAKAQSSTVTPWGAFAEEK